MSTRQRKRINDLHGKTQDEVEGKGENEEVCAAGDVEESGEEEVDEDDLPPARSAPRFVFTDSSSSDEEEEEEEDDEDASVKEVILADLPVLPSAGDDAAGASLSEELAEVEKIDSDEELLDSIIRSNRAAADASGILQGQSSSCSLMRAEEFFQVDSRCLDLDLALRNRFIGDDLDVGRGHPAKRTLRNKSKGKRTLGREFLFSTPKADWPKPPAFIAGGISMTKVAEDTDQLLFSFSWSDDYSILQDRYEMIQQTGDANLLVMFLANYPYHTQGLLTLSTIFFKMGRIDRATDLVRRCLYVFECAGMEAFKPDSGKCRLDPSLQENKTFFQALFRYMFLCAMQRHMVLASNLASLLLALNPMDEVHTVLLQFDYLLLAAGRYEAVQSVCGFSVAASDEEKIEGVVDSDGHWKNCYIIDISPSSTASGDDDFLYYSVEHLPNWWFSLALSLWLDADEMEHSEDRAKARQIASSKQAAKTKASLLLQAAIRKWPFVLMALFQEVLPNSPMLRGLQGNRFFYQARQRVPHGSYLHVVCDVFLLRQSALWSSRPEVLQFLANASSAVLQEVSQLSSESFSQCLKDQERFYHKLSANLGLAKYGIVDREEFMDQVPRFPEGVQPVDDQLADPQVLAGGVRFPHLDRQLEAHRITSMARSAQTLQQLTASRREEEEQCLDLNRPLLQIFFATLFPWVRVPRFYR
eukprot:gene1910-2088_t